MRSDPARVRGRKTIRAFASWPALLIVTTPVLAWSGGQTGAEPPPVTRSELAERIVAVVDERPLFLSDVRALERVRGLAPEAALQEAVDEQLMAAEAGRLAQAEVTPEQERTALASLVAKTPDLSGAVAEPDLRRLVRRQLAILHYVEYRFRPQVQVSDDEVRQAWESEQVGRPEGRALEDSFEAIRSQIERQRLDEKVEAWVQELRGRAEIRYVGAPLPPGP